MRRVTSISASILLSHVRNQRFRVLRLDLKGCDERVVGIDNHMLGFALQLQSDRELQWGIPNWLLAYPRLRKANRDQKPSARGAGSVGLACVKIYRSARVATRKTYYRYCSRPLHCSISPGERSSDLRDGTSASGQKQTIRSS